MWVIAMGGDTVFSGRAERFGDWKTDDAVLSKKGAYYKIFII